MLQPVPNHNPWMLLYFISFLLIVSFFVLNMFVGVVVENFHKCRQHQEAEEARRREEKRLRRLEKKRRSEWVMSWGGGPAGGLLAQWPRPGPDPGTGLWKWKATSDMSLGPLVLRSSQGLLVQVTLLHRCPPGVR